jgi:hypothetical protein
MRLQPKCAGEPNGIDTGLLPPCGFIVAAMDLTVVATAQWDGELIAHLAPERPKLRKPKMVSVRRLASADHARLPGDESNVVLVPNASWLGYCEQALVDAARIRPFIWCGRARPEQQGRSAGLSDRRWWSDHVGIAAAEGRQF